MMQISALRMNGARNTFFIFLPEQAEKINFSKRRKWVRKICREYIDFNTDGAVFLSAEDGKWSWDFYNADGSSADMCGNAARCATLVISEKSGKQKVSFETTKGEVFGTVLSKTEIEVELPKCKDKGARIDIKSLDMAGYFINTGVPHFVVESDPNPELAKKIQAEKFFGPSSTNVTFVSDIKNDGRIRAISFERGVFDFTMACGTGALAAAEYAKIKTNFSGPIFVQMPGGTLTVRNDQGRVFLSGPVENEFEILFEVQDEEI